MNNSDIRFYVNITKVILIEIAAIMMCFLPEIGFWSALALFVCFQFPIAMISVMIFIFSLATTLLERIFTFIFSLVAFLLTGFAMVITFKEGYSFEGGYVLFIMVFFSADSLICNAIGIMNSILGEIAEKYISYIKNNKTALGLFTRPVFGNRKIVLANKYVILTFDMIAFSKGFGKIEVTDKIKGNVYEVLIYKNTKSKFNIFSAFEKFCSLINYETKAVDIINFLTHGSFKHKITKNITAKHELYLDINNCSEAELTAIPGVTIAKAKHAAKVRKEQKMFLSLNQFYKAIELDEEFIEQVKSKGNKILLNDLPDYKQLKIQDE